VTGSAGSLSPRAPPLRAVVFDLDGVLVDTTPLHTQVWEEWFAATPYDPGPGGIQGILGIRGEDVLRAVQGHEFDPEEAERTVDRLYRRIGELARERPPPPRAGAAELLDRLRARGLDLALATSARADTARAAAGELWSRFDRVVTSEDVGRGKPDPEVFLAAAGLLGVSPGECLVVEDALAGVEAARRAGMAVIAITGTVDRTALVHAGADAVIDTLSEVGDLVDRWSGERSI
jgi:beta-phosphoglucomutase